MLKTALMSPLTFAVVTAAAVIALPGAASRAAEETKSDTIGPWEIEAVFKGDGFDRCSISRSLQDDIVVRFIRTADDLSLELESPNWKLEPGKDYPVKMAAGPLSFDKDFAAESNSVSTTIKDQRLERALRSAATLNVVAAGATIRVPLDKSMVALNRLKQCVDKNNKAVETNPFVAPPRAP